MEILSYTFKWLELLLRWGHVLFAILWVGNSFLFNYLDNKLNKDLMDSEVDGEGHLMHSGYFYKISRLKKAPKKFLSELVIFKWQSYLTFITGILLLIIIYYKNAGILIVDKRVMEITPLIAIIISILSIVGSWVLYDQLCKSTLINHKKVFATLIFIIIVVISFALTKTFGQKFAYLSLGIIIGTNMFGNVFTVIIPNQKNIVDASLKGIEIDKSLSLAAKQRSIHNNYSTFLVLFIMLSGHYSFLVYHKYNWAILGIITLISATARHYFNLRGRKINNVYILPISVLALILLASIIFVLKP